MGLEQTGIQAVIWDMGGVLIRTEDRRPRTELAKKFGFTYEMLESIVYGSSSAQEASVGRITADAHWMKVKALLKMEDNFLPEFQRAFWAGDVLDEELVARIDHLRPAIKTGLLSNAWDNARETVGKQFGFLYAFDVSVFSAELKMEKPNPAFYHWMLDQLQVQPDAAIFIDDMPENVKAAEKLGLHGIRFINRDQIIKDLQEFLPF
jgi:epoxide hydrolase-like predicted phosphatase